MDRVTLHACRKLGRHWRWFFLQLGLHETLLDDCEEQENSIPMKCNRAFTKWKDTEGKNATIFKLLKAFCDADLLSTAEEIIDEFNLSGTTVYLVQLPVYQICKNIFSGFKDLLKQYRPQDEHVLIFPSVPHGQRSKNRYIIL